MSTFYERITNTFTGGDSGGITTVDWAASGAGFTISDKDVLVFIALWNSNDPMPSATGPGDWTLDVDEEWTSLGKDVRVLIWSKVWDSGTDIQSTYTAEWLLPDAIGGGGTFGALYWASAGGIASVAHTRYPDPTVAGVEHDAIPGFSDGTWDLNVSGAQAGLVAATYTWSDGDWMSFGADPNGFIGLGTTDPTGVGISYNDDSHSATDGWIVRGFQLLPPPPPSAIRASHNKLRTARLGVS